MFKNHGAKVSNFFQAGNTAFTEHLHYKEVKWSRSPEKSVLLKRTHEVLQQQMLRILL